MPSAAETFVRRPHGSVEPRPPTEHQEPPPKLRVSVRRAIRGTSLRPVVRVCGPHHRASPESLDRLPTAEGVATWPEDAQGAREKAMAVTQPEPDRLRVAVNAVARTGTPIWRVSASNLIPGGWDVEINPRMGLLISARRRPGR